VRHFYYSKKQFKNARKRGGGEKTHKGPKNVLVWTRKEKPAQQQTSKREMRSKGLDRGGKRSPKKVFERQKKGKTPGTDT